MSKNRTIKFTAVVCRWFDKVNGNTYHSVRIGRHRDASVLVCPFTYGYGEHYRQTALAAMAEAKWLPVKYRGDEQYRYEQNNNYPILWIVSDGLKRDCVANGVI
jgi:hypothetical protein